MLLHEIIEHNQNLESSIEVGQIVPYKKALLTIFKREYNGEPVLLVTSVTNNSCYVKIVCANDFEETVNNYVDTIPDLTEEDKEHERELINFQSVLLKDL